MTSSAIFQIETHWGSTVALAGDGITVAHTGTASLPAANKLFLFCPLEWPGFGFLIAEDASKGLSGFSIPFADSPTTALGLYRLIEKGRVGLIHPGNGRFIVAIPPSSEGTEALIEANRVEAGPWEQFALRPVADPPAQVVARAATLAPALRTSPVAAALVNLIQARPADQWAINACSDTLSVEALADAASDVLRKDEVAAALADTFPMDPWATDAIPKLCRWISDRKSSGRVETISPAYDFLEHSGAGVALATLPAKLNAQMRRHVQPSRCLATLATARNEGVYILDWLAYHRAIGIEQAFIYTNDNDDGSDALLESLAACREIVLTRSEVASGVRPQYKAYAHALQFQPEVLDFSWLAVMDLDEFIRLDESRFTNIPEFLGSFDALKADSIGLSWRYHGSAGEARWTDEPVTSRFKKRFKTPDRHLKSIIRPRRFNHSHCHFPFALVDEDRSYMTADGQKTEATPFSEHPDYSNAWVAHYYFKSLEEFIVRRMRNRGDGPVLRSASADMISEGLAALFVDGSGVSDDPVDVPSPALLARVDTEKERLLALPHVANAHAACVRKFRVEAMMMEQILTADPRFAVPSSWEARLLDMLKAAPKAAAAQ